MTFSEITNYIVNRFKQDELVNTIALSDNGITDTKKESIYPLVTIVFNQIEIDETEAVKKYDYTISVLQQRNQDRSVNPSKLLADINYIDNLNECDSICTNFINYVRRNELNNINIETSVLEHLSGYGGANLDGFRFDCTMIIPNTGYCG